MSVSWEGRFEQAASLLPRHLRQCTSNAGAVLLLCYLLADMASSMTRLIKPLTLSPLDSA